MLEKLRTGGNGWSCLCNLTLVAGLGVEPSLQDYALFYPELPRVSDYIIIPIGGSRDLSDRQQS